MTDLTIKAQELLVAVMSETLKSLHRQGLLNEPKSMQDPKIRPMVEALLKKTKTSKYDPCRKFKKGDKVREVLVKGRRFDSGYSELFLTETSEVVKDEDDYHFVRIKLPNGEQHHFDAVFLDLVTPVEEMDPYYIVRHGDNGVSIYFTVHKRGGNVEATFAFINEAEAKEAAEAECARLTAEHRKEQK